MNFYAPAERDPFEHPLDALLADIAVNLQLPPGLHAQTDERYAAVRGWIERPGSPLENKVQHFYPQGSMAIDATISTRGTDDEYDLDVVAQLDLPGSVAPRIPLDLLEAALVGYPVENGVTRQTRCVTLNYADGMHIDVTPSIRLPSPGEHESWISHAKKERPASEHFHVAMNAYAFAGWYRRQTPDEKRFAAELSRRYAGSWSIRAAAEVDEIPEQTPYLAKNAATVALQLLKRYRNIQYANATGRVPPSVLLCYHAARAAAPGLTLSDMLIRLCRLIVQELAAASMRGCRVEVRNPEFDQDVLTDRWPESVQQQNHWLEKVSALAEALVRIKAGGLSLDRTADDLRSLFGDRVVSRSVKAFNERIGHGVQSGAHAYSRRGGLYVPSAPAIVSGAAASSVSTMARPHTFEGGLL